MTKLLFATRNVHKTRELAALLGNNFLLEDLRAHPAIGPIAETGASFLENARIKALTVSQQIGGWIVADDSGLEVRSLGGAPGIFSARYAGLHATDAANRKKLLAELAPHENRRARFVCVLVLANAGKEIASFDGSIEGEIAFSEKGENGFGYDALFVPRGFREVFAEFSAEEKNRVSHRAQAAKHLREFFEKMSR